MTSKNYNHRSVIKFVLWSKRHLNIKHIPDHNSANKYSILHHEYCKQRKDKIRNYINVLLLMLDIQYLVR